MKSNSIAVVLAAAIGLICLSAPPSAAAPDEKPDYPVRVTIRSSERRAEGYGSMVTLTGYVDGTAAELRCSGQCDRVLPGRYRARWDKDKLRIVAPQSFGKRKPEEVKYEVSLQGPKRDLTWTRDHPVLITAYGQSEQECLQPIRLAYNVINKIEHPADWRIVMACTPQSWENASLEFHNIGGTRMAFTMWDDPKVPGYGVLLTVLNAEQFDHCMNDGCYVRVILHELGHFRKISSDEKEVDADAVEHEQALYREHPAAEFPFTRSPNIAAKPLFPLTVFLLDSQWSVIEGGGGQSSGRGNLFVGGTMIAFDFVTNCPDRLPVGTTAPAAYQGRWETEATRLSIVVKRPAPQPPYSCELKTETKPDRVYIRNVNGAVTSIPQEEFKKRVETARATASAKPAAPTAAPGETKAAVAKLTNADVISMVMSNLSQAIITAKIAVSECAFDTSPEGLRQLKAANVPDAVVLEMIKRGAR
ncbi:MAG TPA: hypothetical protein VLV86_20435 [Vicinamibacterales bacterium]|nr:hypothetical protein [Vicinamibacterales bacterium]